MTCIVGLVDNGKVFIGGDSAGVAGWDLVVRADAKVFRNGPFLMGFTTSFRMGQLLRYSLIPPAHDPEIDAHAYLVTQFVGAVRECLKSGGYATKQNEQESGGVFLLAYRGGIYSVEADYQVGKPVEPFAAVGCGAAYAIGALDATQGEPPRERVLKALQAAERHSAGVRGPFIVEVLD